MKIQRAIFSLLFFTSVAMAVSIPADLQDVVIKDRTAEQLSADDQELIDAFMEQVSQAQTLIASFPEQSTHLKKMEMNSNIKSQYYEGKISIQTTCKDKKRLNSMEYLPVLLHEYAHTLFEVNIEHFLGQEKLESADNDKKFDDGEKSPNWNVPVGIIDLGAPYNELFADVYTVLLLDNPTAMSDFFEACNDLANHRNFSWVYTIDPAKPTLDLTAMFTDTHTVLDPVRTFVWRKYMMSDDVNIRERLVHAVFMASQEAIGDYYHRKTTYREWSKMDLVEMNSDLILRINQHLNQN